MASAWLASTRAVRKVTRMCIMMATTFTVAWVPYQMIRLILFNSDLDVLMVLNFVELLTLVNSCVNPIIYSLMWRPFRLALVEVSN